MSGMVQLTVAADVTEAEEIQAILAEAGVAAELESAVVHDPEGTEDVPTKVLVPEEQLELAQEALLAFTEPDELAAD